MLCEDLFLPTKIEGTLKRLNETFEVKRVGSAAELERRIPDEKPTMIIVDLASREAEKIGHARSLKEKFGLKNTLFVGFYPHVAREKQQLGLSLGLDRVVARSALLECLRETLGKRVPRP